MNNDIKDSASHYQLIIWDVAQTLQYPSERISSKPYKKAGLDPDLIEWIADHQNIKHAIISNYPQHYIDELLQQAQITDLFVYASGFDAQSRRKPHLDQYKTMPANLKNIAKHNQLMVGDLPTDMEFADRIGIHGLLIHTKLTPTHPSTQASLFKTLEALSWLNQHVN